MSSVPFDESRASSADREAVTKQLGRALSEGRLTVDEYEQRAAAALAAKTHGELKALTRDLPGGLW